jgi:hypothetical protein
VSEIVIVLTSDLSFDIVSDIYLKEVASTAYGEVCAPYHSWGVRTAVYAGMYTLPTRDQLFVKLNETGNFHCFVLLCLVNIDSYISCEVNCHFCL